MKTLSRVIAVFPVDRPVPQLLTESRLVVGMMTDNKHLPDPKPLLEEVSADLDSLEASQELVRKGGLGMVEQRNVALELVHYDMRQLKAYVQSQADANVVEAEAIITSAGMGIGKKSPRKKPPIHAKQGKVPGSVVLEVRALPRPVQYLWQKRDGQQPWTDLPASFKASTTFEGLTAATAYSFRLRTLTRDGLSDWSAVVSLIVH